MIFENELIMKQVIHFNERLDIILNNEFTLNVSK